jgi:Mrp family chromosome partitioning ATPase
MEKEKEELETKIIKRKKYLEENSEKHDIELEKTINRLEKETSIKKEKVDIYLKNNKKIEVGNLQKDIEEAETNKGFIGMAKELNENEKTLEEAEKIKIDLTEKLEISRNKPNELLKSLDMPLEGLGIDDKGNIILITSSSQGEGKSFCAFRHLCQLSVALLSAAEQTATNAKVTNKKRVVFFIFLKYSSNYYRKTAQNKLSKFFFNQRNP